MSGIKAILTDIEGTTTRIAFVTDTLFPYARAALQAYVAQHERELGPLLDEIRAMEETPAADRAQVIAILERWIDEDRKATPLKEIQGRIWADGYASGAFRGHVYPDAADALRAWHAAGYGLHVYSSGSVMAQKLIFGHSDQGDLTPLFSGWFDTHVGPKRAAESYARIAETIGTPPEAVLFLSDHAGEIEAARAAGMRTLLIDREGQAGIASFAEIDPTALP
jgi:enolase-phosphatase E1